MEPIETVSRMTAMSDVAQHLLAPLSSLIGGEFAHLAECDPMIGAQASVIGPDAGGLYA